MPSLYPDNFADTAKLDRGAVLSGLESDDELNRLPDGDIRVRSEQNAAGTEVPGFPCFADVFGTCADEFKGQLEIVTMGFSLLSHWRISISGTFKSKVSSRKRQ